MLQVLLSQAQPLGGTFQNVSDVFNTSGADAPDLLNELFSRVFGFFTVVGGLALLIYFSIGAINWITAGGDQAKVDTAKKYMTNAAIGMIIIVGAFSIISIIGTVLGFTILDPGGLINNIWGGP